MELQEVVSRYRKVENQLARISRLRKFVISKSQNPKIASTLALTQMRFWTDFFDLKSDKFPPYDILSKTGNLLCFTETGKYKLVILFISHSHTQKPLCIEIDDFVVVCIRVCLSQFFSVIYFVKN